jgi:hypothetical protein
MNICPCCKQSHDSTACPTPETYPVKTPPKPSIEEMLAKCWHGRDWHRLSNLEGAIFARLHDAGYMRHKDGFIYAENTEGLASTAGSDNPKL